MTPAECMKTLGLPPSATPEEVRHAYHRLAHKLHPDKHSDHPQSRERFVKVAEAYRLLRRASRAAQAGERVGTCVVCETFGTVVRSVDGQVVCADCALGRPQRYLPLPVLVVVKCTIPLLMLIASAYLLFKAGAQGSLPLAVAALVTAVCAMGCLAIVCIRVQHCLPASRSRARSHHHYRY